MRRRILIISVVILAGLAVSWLLIAQRQPEWTTASADALGVRARPRSQGKVYSAEALQHFSRVALDPDQHGSPVPAHHRLRPKDAS